MTFSQELARCRLDRQIDWPRFSSAEILQLRKKTNLTRKALGELLKVPEQTVMRWESNAEEIPETANIVLCLIAKLGPDVFKLMEPNADSFALVSCSEKTMDMAQGVDDPQYNQTEADCLDRIPDSFTPDDVKQLRRRLGMNRREFSEFIGISLGTAVNWENGSVSPKGAALALLKILWKLGKDALDFNQPRTQ